MIGPSAAGAGAPLPQVAFDPVNGGLTIRLVNTDDGDRGAVALTRVAVDGVDRTGSVVAAAATDLVTDVTFPRAAAGGGVLAFVMADSLSGGSWYHLQYTISDQAAGSYPFFAIGSPCSTTGEQLPQGIGTHSVLVEIKSGFSGQGAVELIRASGEITLSEVSFYKAEWWLDLAGFREWAAVTDPGRLSGSNAATVLSLAPGGSITQGERFTLDYEIIEAEEVSHFFVPDVGSPFHFTSLPSTPGVHRVPLVADGDISDRAVLARLTGRLSMGFVSLRKDGEGRGVEVEISVGPKSYGGTTVAPLPQVWHVAGSGDDLRGTGSPENPFRTPAQAMTVCSGADTLYLRAGDFAAFDVTVSGHSAAERFRITTLPGEERLPQVIGHDLLTAGRTGNYSAIRLREVNNVEVSHLSILGSMKEGLLLQGQEPEDDVGPPPVYGGHLIHGNKVRQTGSSGIMACGFYPGKRIGIGNAATEVFRLSDVVISYNDVAETNVANDYNSAFSNADGLPGGNNEAITIAASVQGYVVEHNHVHDTLQYGIDSKSGTRGGTIRYNRIWNCTNHGLYIDASRRFVDDLDIHDNVIWGCRNGLVLAREADFDTDDPTLDLADFDMRLEDIRVWNNVIFDMERDGLVCFAHPGDHPSGRIAGIVIRFNTVFNCGQEQAYRDEIRLVDWADPAWRAAGVVRDFEMTGNLVWRDDGNFDVTDDFSGHAAFSINENFNFDGPRDPLFVAPTAAEIVGPGDYLPELSLPDLRLQPGSSAAETVRRGVAGRYNLDAGGLARDMPTAAGAFAMTV